MTSPGFDTLKAANSLKAAGFDDRQAEAVVTTLGGAMIDNLVTKQDLDSALSAALEPMVTKDELRKALEPMATKSDVQLIQHQMTTRLGALVVAGVGVVGILIGIF